MNLARLYTEILTLNNYLGEHIRPSLLIGITSITISLLIPIAIMMLNNCDSNPKNNWLHIVEVERVINLKRVFFITNIIICTIVLLTLTKQFYALLCVVYFLALSYLLYTIYKYIYWINIDTFKNQKFIDQENKILTAEDGLKYWPEYLDFVCSTHDADIPSNTRFYKLWIDASKNIKNSDSEFLSFCMTLVNRFNKLNLRNGTPFLDCFYYQCIYCVLDDECRNKTGWKQLVSIQTEFLKKELKRGNQSIDCYFAINVLNKLVTKDEIKRNPPKINYVNYQFISLVSAYSNPYEANIKRNFKVRSTDFNSDERKHQAFSLTKTFFEYAKNKKYDPNIDIAMNQIFPNASGNVLGLLSCSFDINQFGINIDENESLRILKIRQNIGLFSEIPNPDNMAPTNKQWEKMEEDSINESISIVAGFFNISNYRKIVHTYVKNLLKSLESSKLITLIKSQEDEIILEQKRKLLIDVLKKLKVELKD